MFISHKQNDVSIRNNMHSIMFDCKSKLKNQNRLIIDQFKIMD